MNMDSTLTGVVALTFIRGGIAKSGRPYLQCSNGRSEFFVNVPKDLDGSIFESFEENDLIHLQVSCLVGTDSVKFEGLES